MNTKGLEKGRRRDGMLASKVKAIDDGTESFPAICRGCSTASVSNLLENRGWDACTEYIENFQRRRRKVAPLTAGVNGKSESGQISRAPHSADSPSKTVEYREILAVFSNTQLLRYTKRSFRLFRAT